MDINQIINETISGVKMEWPTLYKIRYIYLKIGSYLSKDTDFFFSVDKKLGSNNLSFNEIKKIYESKTGINFEVMCKSAAYILKEAYNRIGIKAELIKSLNNVIHFDNDEGSIDINHWILAVSDENNTYFLTLASDLPYIQMGMETKHFANNIPYTKELNDGSTCQVYEGKEIKHTVLSKQQLFNIDKEIGYVKNYYNYNSSSTQKVDEYTLQYNDTSLYLIRDSLKNNKLFLQLTIEQTTFFKDLIQFEGANGKIISLINNPITSLTNGDWHNWIKILCKKVYQKICELIGYQIYIIPTFEHSEWNYSSWLLSLCANIQDELFLKLNKGQYKKFHHLRIDVTNFNYNKWSKMIKKHFDHIKVLDHDNILIILDKMNAIVNLVNNHETNKLSNLFDSLAYHFIDSKYILECNIDEKGCLSSSYIANKFQLLFPRIFDCDNTILDFNKMGYSEQIVILKEIINLMFREVTMENSSFMNNYDYNYSAIANRIHLYPIKSKDNGQYSIIFNILGDTNQGDYYFLYDMKNNHLEVTNILGIYNNYIIVSNRMKNRLGIEDLEKIDTPLEDSKTK